MGNYWYLNNTELAFAFFTFKCVTKLWTWRKRKSFKLGLFDDCFENTASGVFLEFVYLSTFD